MKELELRENTIDVDTYLKAERFGRLEKTDQEAGTGSS